MIHVVRATLGRHRQAGAVAEKFEMAYLRPLDIGNPPGDQAEAAWRGKGDYKALQDYIFRFIATECGALGSWEPVLNDPVLKPNAYVDFSEQTYLQYPGQVALAIRFWLELVPEKVLFAEALGIALTGMMRDGEIDRPRAAELARMVLRDNARALYKLN